MTDKTGEEENPKTRAPRRVFVGVFWGISVLLLLMLAGLMYQSVSVNADVQAYPPPGKRYNVGGIGLHIYCTGKGNRTVILEAGAAGPGRMWAPVQAALSQGMRVCSYDRVGLGWSDPAPTPRTSANMVTELHTLLEKAAVLPPYVLVGHSLGAYNVRLFASQYPEEVAGVVLVNAAQEDFSSQQSPGCQKISQANTKFARWMKPLATLGIVRLAGTLGLLDGITSQVIGSPPADLKSELMHLTFYRPLYWQTFTDELSNISIDEELVRQAARLGSLPLVVVSGSPDVGRIPASSGCKADELISLSDAGQIELTGLSTNSSWIDCQECGHYIPLTHPNLVVEAVKTVISLGQ